MSTEPKTQAGPYADIAPALNDYTQGVLFGRVWESSGLSKRDRSLVTVAALVALYRTNELPFHLKFAHLAFYTGWPNANTAVEIARKIFGEVA